MNHTKYAQPIHALHVAKMRPSMEATFLSTNPTFQPSHHNKSLTFNPKSHPPKPQHHARTTLLNHYAKRGFLSKARNLFDAMLSRDVVAWTTMLMAYSNTPGHKHDMLVLFHQMLTSGVEPNKHTITTILRCIDADEAKLIHSLIEKRGWGRDAFVGATLVAMYAKARLLGSARMVLDRIEHKDVVCFNSLVSGYGRVGDRDGLLSVFVEMGLTGFTPNASTYIGMLNGCARLGSPSLSRQLHALTIVSGYILDGVVETVLVDMYAKCGILEEACAVFDGLKDERSVLAWNSIICGYGKHGYAKEAIKVFRQMEASSVVPDHITFTCLLSACAHSGLVHEGLRLFKDMKKLYKIPPRSEHYGCIVDLLGRAGLVSEAYEVATGVGSGIESASVWGALLSACKMWGNVQIGEIAAKRLFKLEPDCSSNYVVFSDTLAANGKMDDAVSVRESMDFHGIKKDAGCSWIEVDGEVYKFRAGGCLDH